MTVKELINKLSEYDTDMKVLVEVDKPSDGIYLEGQDISKVEDMTDYVFLIISEVDDENL